LLSESTHIDEYVFAALQEFDQLENEFRIKQIIWNESFKTVAGNASGQEQRFCELDMNMLSSVGWSLHLNFTNRVKYYVKLLKFMASQFLRKDQSAGYQVIFYSSVYQLIRLGIIDLEEFLNPDGVGADIGCEMYQKSMDMKFLP
jgi:hypothetical protein